MGRATSREGAGGILELDAASDGAAMRQWGTRHTIWSVGGVLALVAVLAFAFSLPRGVQGPEIPGLPDRPEVAWSASAPEGGDLAGLIACGPDGEGIGVAALQGERLRIECRRKLDGAGIWERDYPSMLSTLGGGGGDVAAVVSDDAAVMISRLDGRPVRTIALPAGGGNSDSSSGGRLALTSGGDALTVAESDDLATVSKLADAGDGVDWTAEVGTWRLGTGLSSGLTPLTEHEGYLWDEASPGHYTLALSERDGTEPEWGVGSRQLSFVGRVVVASSTDEAGLVAHDIRTGRMLWSVPSGVGQEFVAGDDAFYAVDLRVSPAEDVTISRIDPHSGRVEWSAALDHPVDLVRAFGDVLVAVDASLDSALGQGSVVTVLRAGTGEQAWSTELAGVGAQDLLFGEDQLLVSTYRLEQRADGVEQVRGAGTALDMRTGALRWEVGDAWLDRNLGAMLIPTDEGAIDVYR